MSSWFSAVLLFEAEVNGEFPEDGLCEASLRLVEASDIDVAHGKASALGLRAEHGYLNESGERVEWKFRRVAEVQVLGETTSLDGIEVFSRMYRSGDQPGAWPILG